MERLTKLFLNTNMCNASGDICEQQKSSPYDETCCCYCEIYQKMIDKLAEYEDAEEQGLLLRLPYPLGTEHIYFADENDMDVYRLDAEKIEVHMMPISRKVMYTIDCFEFFIEDFGKIVFLTESEAKQALAQMKGDQDER